MTEPISPERLTEIAARIPAGEHPWRIDPRIVGYEGGQEEREEGFEIWTATADGEHVVADVHDEWAADEDDCSDDGTRVVQIDSTHDVHPDAASVSQFILHSQRDVPDLLAEVKRLTGELAKYTGWEPTVREEYEHACDQLRRIEGIVKWFDADRGLSEDPLALASNVDSFVASLKHALET